MAASRDTHEFDGVTKNVEETNSTSAALETDQVSKKEIEDPELDDLLDNALEDFDKCQTATPPPPPTMKADSMKVPESTDTATPDPQVLLSNLLGNQVDPSVTSDFDKAMEALMADINKQQEDPQLKEQLEKLVGAASSDPPFEGAAAGGAQDFSRTLGETMNRMAQSTAELKKEGGLSEDDLMKAMGGMNLEEGLDMDFMPMMQNMMQNLLSKEVLYPSVKEIVEKYPMWLEENKSKLKAEEYSAYELQHETMKSLCDEYESENVADSDQVKKERFERIMQTVQKMESLGQPPKDLVGEMAPGIEFDDHGNPKLPGLPSADQCTVM
ncbi:peroxisomal biogenesis factor 19-like [Saccoglossus kowalevskii]|uniref:Peroxin-19 n=1 Tax=Saccoglossus kowalevskii TaxID=10224 RepID=A0ABM0MCG8_SACKO|nr:PREDICTED: peroxisomal biogenesis factor 19-like [Saccoglossus kowalevskii]